MADISLPAIRAKCPTHGVQRFEWWPEDRSWLCVECNICHTSNGICSCKVAVVVREFIDRDGADHVWWRKKNGPMIDYEPVEVLHIVERDLERKNGCSPT